MAANDDLPRGVTVTSQQSGTGSAALVTFPAMFGLAWVLTNVEAMALTIAGYTGMSYTPQILIGGSVVAALALSSVVGARDDWTLPGDGITFPTQTAVAVTFSIGATTGTYQAIIATAKPVRSL